VDGTNIFFINLLTVVAFVIVDYFVLREMLGYGGILASPATIFTLALVSVIPLAYFIGQAVASISAQSSMGMGATINAFFSTIVEVYLYCIALQEGKGRLVEGSIMGSIFAGVILMPGVSMCSGAIKRKTQRFNARSAGVTSTMLLFAVIAAFAPTLFYQIHGTVSGSLCDFSSLIPPCSLLMVFVGSMISVVALVHPQTTPMNAVNALFPKHRQHTVMSSMCGPFSHTFGSLPSSCSFLTSSVRGSPSEPTQHLSGRRFQPLTP
jgi:calcium/proton exchanger cax